MSTPLSPTLNGLTSLPTSKAFHPPTWNGLPSSPASKALSVPFIPKEWASTFTSGRPPSPSPVTLPELNAASPVTHTSPSPANEDEIRLTNLRLSLGLPTRQKTQQQQQQGANTKEGKAAVTKVSRVGRPKHLEKLHHIKRRKFSRSSPPPRRIVPGHVYIIESTSHPGPVKVGKARDPNIRVSQLQKDCNLQDAKVVYHTRRLVRPELAEILTHRRLSQYRRRFYCEHDGTWHREWFACSVWTAKHTIEKALKDPMAY